jgi:hypothetical protein
METTQIWEWFASALVHDLGKTSLNQAGTWEVHHDLARTPFGEQLPANIVQHVAQHHDEVDFEAGSHTPRAVALIMADRFQKAMHQTEDWEQDERLSKLTHHPAFYPFYGSPEEGWDQHKAQVLGLRIQEALKKKLSLCHLLELQAQVTGYPHTTYLPHLSLALHHRFTALLLYFLMRRMDGGLPPTELEFSILEVNLEPMALFYRLRDVSIYARAVKMLRDELFRRVFLADQSALPGLSPNCNPFEFFDRGDGLVLVYDCPRKIIQEIQEILDERELLRSLSLEVTDFHLSGKWKQSKTAQAFYAEPKDVKTHSYALNLFSQQAMRYPYVSLERCQVCGKPGEELVEDITGDILCSSCLQERQRRRDKVVDIHLVSDNGAAKVGFIFLTVKEPLYEHAQEVATNLLGEFMSQRMVEPRILRPTRGGLFEYLQAIQAMGAFQDRVQEVMAGFQREKLAAAYTLLRLPTKMVYLVHEDFYWRLLSFLNAERTKLRLSTSLRAVLCHPKMPFWSLMDRFITYEPGDLYYDTSEGSIVMFTKEEVKQIREIASLAEQQWRSAAQLNALSRFARNHTLDELLLEIDVRARHNKLARRLPKPLKKALETLEYHPDDEAKNRLKRAKFIDYIAKLAKPMGRR